MDSGQIKSDEAKYENFRLIECDGGASYSSASRVAAEIRDFGSGLRLARHKRLGYHAIVWFPGVSHWGYQIPIVGNKPEVMFEFRGQAHEPGEWMVQFLRKHQISRIYPSIEAYDRHLKQEQEREFARMKIQSRARREDRIRQMMDRAYTHERAGRTIVCGIDLKAG